MPSDRRDRQLHLAAGVVALTVGSAIVHYSPQPITISGMAVGLCAAFGGVWVTRGTNGGTSDVE